MKKSKVVWYHLCPFKGILQEGSTKKEVKEKSDVRLDILDRVWAGEYYSSRTHTYIIKSDSSMFNNSNTIKVWNDKK